MLRYLLLMFVFVFAMVMQAATVPYAFVDAPENAPWWVERIKKERICLVDHLGKTNWTLRLKTATNVICRVGNATVSPDLKVLTYTVGSAPIENWSIANVCPGTYNLQTNVFYTEMTDEAKTALWVAYTNTVIQAKLASEAERTAPAKFDVSKTPAEFKAELLGDRDVKDLTPEERREFRQEYGRYVDEWVRINEPDKWRPTLEPFKSENRLTEQQKIKAAAGRERMKAKMRAIRARRMLKKEAK